MHPVLGLTKDDRGRAFEHLFRHFHAVDARLLKGCLTHLDVAVVKGGQTMEGLDARGLGLFRHLFCHAVRRQKCNPLVPDLIRFAHGHPDVGVDKIRTFKPFGMLLGEGDPGSGSLCDRPALCDEVSVGPAALWAAQANVYANQGGGHHQA